jgi:hypothetical protein
MRAGFGDERRELHSQHSLQGKVAIAVCISFVVGWCFMAWDYSMTLSLHFQQTMYAWIVFMGGWVNMIMALSLLSMWWRNHLDMKDLVTMDQLWDLGKLGFAFTVFRYISFSQYRDLVRQHAREPLSPAPDRRLDVGDAAGADLRVRPSRSSA